MCRKLQSTGLAVKDLRDVAQVRVVLHPRHPAPPAGTSPADHLKDQNQLCYNVMGLVRAISLAAPAPPTRPPPVGAGHASHGPYQHAADRLHPPAWISTAQADHISFAPRELVVWIC